MKMKKRIFPTILSTLLLTACSQEGIVYDHSADVDPSGWTPADTLFYNVRVVEEPMSGFPVGKEPFNQLSLAVRYERSFPCSQLPLHLLLDNGQPEHIVSLSLADSTGLPDGDHWSTLYTKQFDVTAWPIHFGDTGTYVLKVWPDTAQQHICSLTVTLKH